MSGRIHDFDPDEIEFLTEIGSTTAGAERESRGCPAAARMRAFAAGALPHEQKRAIGTHLDECQLCRLMVRELERWPSPESDERVVGKLWERVQPRLAGALSKPARRRWLPWSWLAAPAAAVVLSAVVLFRMLLPGVAPPNPLRAAIAAPDYDAAAIAPVDKAPVRLPIEGLLLWRNSGQSAVPTQIRDIADALVPYRNGDFAESVKRLTDLSNRYPKSYEVKFYLGVSLLLRQRPEDAKEVLKEAVALADPVQTAEASWYLSLAYLRAGSIRDARPYLTELCSGGAGNADSACRVLRQLALPSFAPPRR